MRPTRLFAPRAPVPVLREDTVAQNGQNRTTRLQIQLTLSLHHTGEFPFQWGFV